MFAYMTERRLFGFDTGDWALLLGGFAFVGMVTLADGVTEPAPEACCLAAVHFERPEASWKRPTTSAAAAASR